MLPKPAMIGGRWCTITDLNSAVQPKPLLSSNTAPDTDELYQNGETSQESQEEPHTISSRGVTSGVWPQGYHLKGITSGVSPHGYHLRGITSEVSPLRYHLWGITSEVSPQGYHLRSITSLIHWLVVVHPYNKIYINAWPNHITYKSTPSSPLTIESTMGMMELYYSLDQENNNEQQKEGAS